MSGNIRNRNAQLGEVAPTGKLLLLIDWLTDCRSGSTSRESGRLSGGGGSSRAVLFNNALRAGRGALRRVDCHKPHRASRPPAVCRPVAPRSAATTTTTTTT